MVSLRPDGITTANLATLQHRCIHSHVSAVMLGSRAEYPHVLGEITLGSVVITQRGQEPVIFRRTVSPIATTLPIQASSTKARSPPAVCTTIWVGNAGPRSALGDTAPAIGRA